MLFSNEGTVLLRTRLRSRAIWPLLALCALLQASPASWAQGRMHSGLLRTRPFTHPRGYDRSRLSTNLCSSRQPKPSSRRIVAVTKEEPDRGVRDGVVQGKEAKLLDPARNDSDKEGR